MGRRGALHSVFGEAHVGNQTPHHAVLLSSIAAFLPAAIMAMRGMNLFDIYGLTGTLATFGFVTAYILVSAAAPIYLRSRGCLTPQAVGISVLAICVMGAALLGSLYPVPPSPYSLLPYFYTGMLVIGFVGSLIWSARPKWLDSPSGADLDAAPNETD
jgi:amino acid transporter